MYIHRNDCHNGTGPHLVNLPCMPGDIIRYVCQKLGEKDLLALMRVSRFFQRIIKSNLHLFSPLRARHIVHNLINYQYEQDLGITYNARVSLLNGEIAVCVVGAGKRDVILLNLTSGKALHRFILKAPASSMLMDSEYLFIRQEDVVSQCSLKDFKVIDRSLSNASAMILLRDYLVVLGDGNSHRVFSRGAFVEQNPVNTTGKIQSTSYNDTNCLVSLKENTMVALNIATNVRLEYPLQKNRLVQAAIRAQVLFLTLVNDSEQPWLRTVDLAEKPYAVVNYPKMSRGSYDMCLFHQFVLFFPSLDPNKIHIAHLSTLRLIPCYIMNSFTMHMSDGKISMCDKIGEHFRYNRILDFGFDLPDRPVNSHHNWTHKKKAYRFGIAAAAICLCAIGIVGYGYYQRRIWHNTCEFRRMLRLPRSSYCDPPNSELVFWYRKYILACIGMLCISIFLIYKCKAHINRIRTQV